MSVLKKSWCRLWPSIGGIGDGDQVFGELCDRYSESQRKYHTLQHLVECLHNFELVFDLAPHPAAVEMALWFHDAVYEPNRHDNEIKSAELADRLLTVAIVDRESIDLVTSLILATQHTVMPQNLDQALLVDIDLAILGAESMRFAEYEQQIRAEYFFVPETLFKQKRREILSSFLLRPNIYSTKYFNENLAANARKNLITAVTKLD